ncbi:RNA 2'-phosphotransferase [Alteromonadaceae bacterium M269]|nr:RNA 2'-phosphotransferase [Alteromonadaceae bacterium M269]
MDKQITKISKYLSYLLRHKPEAIGLTLDANGWANIQELIDKTSDFDLTHEMIQVVVETNDKQRFALDKTGGKIRANQGHSINVDLRLSPQTPPDRLLHGTAERFYDSIKSEGLTKQERHHVHLSESAHTTSAVGSRYGKPVLLEINAQKMFKDGYQFYRTANNVWLVDKVPAEYISKVG